MHDAFNVKEIMHAGDLAPGAGHYKIKIITQPILVHRESSSEKHLLSGSRTLRASRGIIEAFRMNFIFIISSLIWQGEYKN